MDHILEKNSDSAKIYAAYLDIMALPSMYDKQQLKLARDAIASADMTDDGAHFKQLHAAVLAVLDAEIGHCSAFKVVTDDALLPSKLEIRGTARASKTEICCFGDEDGGDESCVDCSRAELIALAQSCGSEADFTDYIPDELLEIVDAVKGAFMHFEYNTEIEHLETVVVYELLRLPYPAQCEAIMDYTQGQWSDGIGEGYEQQPAKTANGTEFFISPWHDTQEIAWRIL